MRVILPLIDQWEWVGGVKSFAELILNSTHTHTHARTNSKNVDKKMVHGEEAFWQNESVIAAWESVIRQVVGRRNTVNGVLYSEDPTILAWETGNELNSPSAWTRRMAKCIKDACGERQLVIDGKQGVDVNVLECEDVDVCSRHYYPGGLHAYGHVEGVEKEGREGGKMFSDALMEDLRVCAGE